MRLKKAPQRAHLLQRPLSGHFRHRVGSLSLDETRGKKSDAGDVGGKLNTVQSVRSGGATLTVLPLSYEFSEGGEVVLDFGKVSVLALLSDRNRTLIASEIHTNPHDLVRLKSAQQKGERVSAEIEYGAPRCGLQSDHFVVWNQSLSAGSDGQRISIQEGEPKQMQEGDCGIQEAIDRETRATKAPEEGD